jgi:hypothetical protein
MSGDEASRAGENQRPSFGWRSTRIKAVTEREDMVRTLRTIAKAGAVAVVLWLGPGVVQARAQVSFLAATPFGAGFYWGGSYYFNPFSLYSPGYPIIPYGWGYGYGFGYGYGWPYFFEPTPLPYPYFSFARYPIFSYVTPDQNSPLPKVIELRPDLRSPSEGPPDGAMPGDDRRPAPEPSAGQRRAREARQSIVYRANIPRPYKVNRRPQTGRLVVFRSTAP